MATPSVSLVIQVHDCFMEVGHSRAMMELIRNSDLDRIRRVDIVSFGAAKPAELLPSRPDLIHCHHVPFGRLKPFLLKAVFFNVWTLLRRLICVVPEAVHVSIGTASFVADVCNVQFVHAQWEREYFRIQRLSPMARVYKKALFAYSRICEGCLYTRSRVHLIVPSSFVATYCREKYRVPEGRMTLVYSGVNLDDFKPSAMSRADLFRMLVKSYPALQALDVSRPIYLFVGAYERKGLPEVLEMLSGLDRPQLIVIGRHESHRTFSFPDDITVVEVKFTRNVDLFYSLADAFMFPSWYEPYGLVIIEAVAMGMLVFVNRANVGASEVLEGLKGVYFLEDPETRDRLKVPILSREAREQLRESRLPRLREHDWRAAGRQFTRVMSDIAVRKGAHH